MEKIKLRISGNQIEVTECPAVITSGTVGLPAEFAFDSLWDGLHKVAVFHAGEKTVAVTMEEDTLTVPWEVLKKPKLWLGIGVYGVSEDGAVAIPTLWAQVAVIHTGTDPEGDPAADPTSPVWQEIRQELQGITLESLGGVDAQYVTDALEEMRTVVAETNTVVRDNNTAIKEHRENAENPHNVTCEQVGAAPTGFGLGEKLSALYNWNTAYFNGFVYGNSNSPDGEVWWGLNCKYQNILGSQIAFRNANGQLIEARRYFRNNDGVWEYVNPPMEPGVEYRTTERWKGKPVYTKLIECGAVADEKVVEWGEQLGIIRTEGCIVNSDGVPICPLPNGPENWLEFFAETGTAVLHCDTYYADRECTFNTRLWYVK